MSHIRREPSGGSGSLITREGSAHSDRRRSTTDRDARYLVRALRAMPCQRCTSLMRCIRMRVTVLLSPKSTVQRPEAPCV